MVKRIIFFSAILSAAVLAAASAVKTASVDAYTDIDASENEIVASVSALSSFSVPDHGGYTVRLEGNGMSVSRSGSEQGTALILQAEIDADGLRQSDRAMLEEGITVTDYEEVLRLLEDFSS